MMMVPCPFPSAFPTSMFQTGMPAMARRQLPMSLASCEANKGKPLQVIKHEAGVKLAMAIVRESATKRIVAAKQCICEEGSKVGAGCKEWDD